MERSRSRSRPISPISPRLTGRTPLSLISISTTFSHVDCMRSISNFSILIDVFGDIKIFYSKPGEVGDGPRGAGAALALSNVLKFAEAGALFRRIEPEHAGATEDFRIEFLLPGRVRSDGGDMR